MSSKSWQSTATVYDPIKCGSIDGTDTVPHDKGIIRALNVKYKPNDKLTSKPSHVLFVGRLSHVTKENEIKEAFSRFGKIENVSLVRDVITGFSRGYAFVEYIDKKSVVKAVDGNYNITLHNSKLLLDYEHGRTLKNWVPRRLGGGFGGKKESGQLRFGCKDRPFKRPISYEKDNYKERKRPYERSYERKDNNQKEINRRHRR